MFIVGATLLNIIENADIKEKLEREKYEGIWKYKFKKKQLGTFLVLTYVCLQTLPAHTSGLYSAPFSISGWLLAC